MAQTHNAYSDLIHLFIDGEATDTERNTLFGALKDSPELQEEFSSAMRLKQAFSADIMQLQPPTYLQSQIAERAGILVAASATAANAPVISSALSNAVSNVAPVATGILSKGVVTLLIGASVGILSTIGIIKLTSNDAKTSGAPQAMEQAFRPSAQASNQIKLTPSAPIETAKGEFKTEQKISSGVKVEKTKETLNNATTQETPIIEKNSPVTQTEKESPAFSFISPIEPTTPRVNNMGESRNNIMSPLNAWDLGPTGTGRLSLRLTGIMGSKLYQGMDMTFSTAKSLDFEIAAKYDFDPSNAIGVEVGHEAFPLYLSNDKGGYDQQRSLLWYGASWTYSAVYLDLPLGIHPELRGVAAWSNAGPIVKASLGLALPITPRVSLSLDGEETMLFIKSNGVNITGNKAAITGALTFHF
jgi:hypothetical protein